MMTARKLTQVYLDPSQKEGLENRAKAKGTKVSHEIRRAVDVYLSGVTPEDLEILDVLSREAEKNLQAMANRLEATNRKLDEVFAELERIRNKKVIAA
jgi:BMFP domain-containing protein YqiC